MITYSLWFYEVDASHLSDFVTAFHNGGIVHELSRRIPGHIHTDLLSDTEAPSRCCRLLSISFFTSFEALLHAEQSSEMRAFSPWLRERAKQCVHLGTFSHFSSPQTGIPCMETIDQVSKEITPTEIDR